jgi:hypothetical protein
MKTPIDKLMDAQYIKRWAIVGTATENNLATHSFNVAMLAMEIYKRMPDMYMRYSERDICFYALIHDIGEVYTGDIPTPTKVKMLKAGLDINTFDPEVAEEAWPSEEVKKIVKAADLIDNYIFIKDNGIGSRARAAMEEVLGRLMRFAGEAEPSLGKAMLEVYSYVEGRLSDVIKEGKRAEGNYPESAEKAADAGDFDVMGRKP